jgi:hypothetical protein
MHSFFEAYKLLIAIVVKFHLSDLIKLSNYLEYFCNLPTEIKTTEDTYFLL